MSAFADFKFVRLFAHVFNTLTISILSPFDFETGAACGLQERSTAGKDGLNLRCEPAVRFARAYAAPGCSNDSASKP